MAAVSTRSSWSALFEISRVLTRASGKGAGRLTFVFIRSYYTYMYLRYEL